MYLAFGVGLGGHLAPLGVGVSGHAATGVGDRKAFTGATQAECLEKKQAYLKRMESEEARQAEADAKELEALRKGHTLEAEIPFGEAFLPWLKLYKSPPSTKPTTYGSYVETYNTHLGPFFGELPLHTITTDVVQEYYQTRQKEGARRDGKKGGLSAKTIRNHHMLLKDFFAFPPKPAPTSTQKVLRFGWRRFPSVVS